jgi:hypothetical protein
LDRVRRIETRLTRYLETQGFDTQTQRPVLEPGPEPKMHIPSMHISLKDMLAAIPADLNGWEDIEVQHAGRPVAYLSSIN